MEPSDIIIRRSFVTGSHAYGTPGRESDIDLVVIVTEADLLILMNGADERNEWDAQYQERAPQAACLRFGNLNLIACTSEETFEVWRKGTRQLKANAPVLRSVACGLFAMLRAKHLEGESDREARARGDRVRQALVKDDRYTPSPTPRDANDDPFTNWMNEHTSGRRDEEMPF